ncbi:hypothetical protein SDC9_89508 [bioreactor metagenome]|uniref:Uncharacterized protein n=1 Tax=bioreactor metagenome TaxID=1076179 RepID=A0A644ZQ03_9ZZZZ
MQLFGNAVVLKLNIKVLAEHALQSFCVRKRVVVPPCKQRLRNIARKARRKADQAFRMLAQQIVINARLIVEPAQERLARKEHQVLITCSVFAKQN